MPAAVVHTDVRAYVDGVVGLFLAEVEGHLYLPSDDGDRQEICQGAGGFMLEEEQAVGGMAAETDLDSVHLLTRLSGGRDANIPWVSGIYTVPVI